MKKREIIESAISVEGGYSDNSDDSGGKTNFGITENVARKYGYLGGIRDLPKHIAISIYEEKYWNKIKGDELLSLSPEIASEVFDTSVNMGVSRSSKFLQRSLNLLNKKQKLYSDLLVDGKIGRKTVRALEKYLQARDEGLFVKLLNIYQGAFYVKLAERREKDESFIYGWIKQRI